MEHKHTAGTWRFYTEPQPNGCPIVGSGGLMVAQLAHSINYPEQRDTAIANARLIAASPDLLTALIALRVYLSKCPPHAGDTTGAEWGRVMDLSGAAIIKATGSQT